MKIIITSCVFLILFTECYSLDFATIGGLVAMAYNKIACNFKECCNKENIPANFRDLERRLEMKLYGQHIVTNVVLAALKAHWSEGSKPNKALTLSFHGTPGSGKNYVAKFIQEALYKDGPQSIHTHHIVARLHFPEENKVQQYQEDLKKWITGNITACPKQLFIFDEVDKMPHKVLDVIKPFIDYHDYIGRVDYKQAIYIFLSNTGSQIITETMLDLWKSGKNREDVKLNDFEKLITQGAFNEEGGFYHSDNIRSNLIDHYIPFLPMDQENIILCIKDEFKKHHWYPTESQIQEVLNFIDWGPEPDAVFAKTGCKRISQKVSLVRYQ